MQTPGSTSDPGVLRDDCSSAPLDVCGERPQSPDRLSEPRPKVSSSGWAGTKPAARRLSRPESPMNAFLRAPVSARPHARGAVASEGRSP